MSKKKQYKNRLPTVLPPAPRRAPEMESLPPAPPPAPPAPEAREPGPRSRVLLVALLLLGPMVVVAALLATYLGSRGEGGAGERDPGPAVAQEPLGAAADESYVEARVQPDGEIVVRQWIEAREPLARIVLSLPEVPDNVLSAADVRVLADDVRATGPRTITAGPATYGFAESTDVEVRYRLLGAVVRSSSATGRALAVATTLNVSYAPRPKEETRVVRAPAVLSMACTSSVSLAPAPCGTPLSPDEWRVDLTGARVLDLVIAQVTLDDELIPDAADAS